MTVALREFKPLYTAGLIIDRNFDPTASRSWSVFLTNSVEIYQNYF